MLHSSCLRVALICLQVGFKLRSNCFKYLKVRFKVAYNVAFKLLRGCIQFASNLLSSCLRVAFKLLTCCFSLNFANCDLRLQSKNNLNPIGKKFEIKSFINSLTTNFIHSSFFKVIQNPKALLLCS